MIFTIFIVVFVLIGLVVLHEFGHFILAKKFGVEVEEFGIGYPPRIFGRKIGDTLYSLNLLPFGAFVRIKGEEGGMEMDIERAFFGKPIWQRSLILLGGVVSFWIIAFLILSFVAFWFGIPTVVSDEVEGIKSEVKILNVAENSPAELAGIKPGDVILKIKVPVLVSSQNGREKEKLTVKNINKVKELQKFVDLYRGKSIILTLKRGKKIFEVPLVPRLNPPEGEGAMGVALVRIVTKKYSWYQAPLQGALLTFRQTITLPLMLGHAFQKWIRGERVEEVKLMGPIGIGQVMNQALQAGVANFLLLVAMISIWLALFNLLPIPALDGGKILFLLIEGIRRKPVSPKIEQKITTIFFVLLIFLMIFVTFKDLSKLF